MRPFFEDKRRELAAEIERWVGTPWRHREHRRQAGCDCIGFVYGVMVAVGFLSPDTPLPEYPRDWHLHNKAERLVDGLRAVPWMLEIHVADKSDGDVLVFRYGNTGSHVGICMGRGVFHAPTGLKVMRSPLAEFSGRLKFAFRPMMLEAAA